MAITRAKQSSLKTGVTKYDNFRGGLPYTPTIGTATDGGTGTTVSVAFTGNNTAGLTYTVLSSPGSLTATGTTSPITVSGLTSGTAYTFQVKATNSAGDSPYSAASNSVTPVVPAPVYSLAASLYNTQNWTVPSGVTRIAVYAFGGGGAGFRGVNSGGAGGGAGAGGGGAAFKDYTVTSGTSYLVTVGSGGVWNSGSDTATSGSNSSFGNLISSGYGGAGGSVLISTGGTVTSGNNNVSNTVFMTTSSGGDGGGTTTNAAGSTGFAGTAPSTLTLTGTGLVSYNIGGGGGGGGGGGNRRNTNGTSSGGSYGLGANGNDAGGGGRGGNGGSATLSAGTPSANAGSAGLNYTSAPNWQGAGGGGGGGGSSRSTSNNNATTVYGAPGAGGNGGSGAVFIYTSA